MVERPKRSRDEILSKGDSFTCIVIFMPVWSATRRTAHSPASGAPNHADGQPDVEASVARAVILRLQPHQVSQGLFWLEYCRRNPHLGASVGDIAYSARAARYPAWPGSRRYEGRVAQTIHEVQNRGGTAAQILQAAHHRSEVGILRRHRLGGGEGDCPHPLLHGHVLAQALDRGLEEVGVDVEQAGKSVPPRRPDVGRL